MDKKTKTKRTPKKRTKRDWTPAALAVLRETCNISAACDAAGICRNTFYVRRDNDPAFATLAADAMDAGVDALELEARRRGHNGVDKPVIWQGELCGIWVNAQGEKVPAETKDARFIPLTVKEYSDTLLIFLLKAHRPDKFRERYDLNATSNMNLNVKGKLEVTVDPIARIKERANRFELERSAAGVDSGGRNGAQQSLDPPNSNGTSGIVSGQV